MGLILILHWWITMVWTVTMCPQWQNYKKSKEKNAGSQLYPETFGIVSVTSTQYRAFIFAESHNLSEQHMPTQVWYTSYHIHQHSFAQLKPCAVFEEAAACPRPNRHYYAFNLRHEAVWLNKRPSLVCTETGTEHFSHVTWWPFTTMATQLWWWTNIHKKDVINNQLRSTYGLGRFFFFFLLKWTMLYNLCCRHMSGKLHIILMPWNLCC